MPRHLLLVTLLALIPACQGADTPAPPAAATQTAATAPAAVTLPRPGLWLDMFDGKTLANWKVPEFGADGKVTVKNGELHIGMGDGCTGVTWTGPIIQENYEIELEGKRVEGHDFWCALTFPIGKENASLVLGGWGGSLVGISCINGYDASDNPTTQMQTFEENTWYQVRVRVTKAKVEAWLDEKQIINLDRDEEKKFSVRMEVDESLPLGIATWRTHGALRNIRMRQLAE